MRRVISWRWPTVQTFGYESEAALDGGRVGKSSTRRQVSSPETGEKKWTQSRK